MFLRRRLKKVGEGKNVVIYLSKEHPSTFVSAGLFKQEGKVFRDKKGRYVIIIRNPIRAFQFPPCTQYPYLWGNYDGGVAGGSITYAKDTSLYTNWHVATVTNTVCYNGDNNYATASMVKAWKPKLKNCAKLEMMLFIKRLFRTIDSKYCSRIYSQYDFALMQTSKSVNTQWDMPPLVFFAGSCLAKEEANCIGLAFPNPLLKQQLPEAPFRVKGYCTLWQFESEGTAYGPVTVTVNYENGKCAVFRDAYAIVFDQLNFIPGCSGSPIFIEIEQPQG
jgi:hypothetical protein